MKIFRILFTVLFMLWGFSAHAAHQLYADIDGITIPYGTKFQLTMAQNLTSKEASQGDIFQAYLNEDIYVNSKLILPSGTIFRGRVSNIDYSKNLSRPATLYLTFDHLVTKSGVQLPINSGLSSDFNYILTNENGLTTNGNYFKRVASDWRRAGKIVSRTYNWGKTAGDDLFTGAKILYVPVATAGGICACAGSGVYNTVADLFRHGDEIIIKQGTKFSIILLSSLDIPM